MEERDRKIPKIQEWWDVTKTKIKYLTMQISKQLKKGQNKKDRKI